ncbi:MAG: putative amidohydrolase [Lysobacterales bacterium]|jgi:predicted amidohydrolase
MSHLAIAGLQLELAVEDNLALIEHEIALVKQRFPWIQMVVLPELATYGPSTELAIKLPGEVENCYQEAARKHDIWLIPGSLFEKRDGKVYNTAPVINPAGEIVTRYSKMYPFLPYEKGVESGNRFVVFDVPGVGRLGLMICYDMWYPEMARQLAWMGAEAIIVPTQTNTNDRSLELSMAQANAAMNQAYLININNAGRMAYGRSIVVGPDGTIVHQASSGREIITVELDFEHVRRVRERGIHGLAQPLKSFRDANISYPVYQDGAGPGAFGELGKLQVPKSD